MTRSYPGTRPLGERRSASAPSRARPVMPPSSAPTSRRVFAGREEAGRPWETQPNQYMMVRPSRRPPRPPQRVASSVPPMIGNYEITGLLGSGGMADVYVGVHAVLGRKVAIKLLRLDLVADGNVRKRFLQEARITHRLRHPNVVDIIDVGQMLDGRLFLVMELLEGQTLAQRLEAGRMPPIEAIEVLRQVCAGLAAAHDAGIYHRDLKPENIFLVRDPDGCVTAKILDWGVARVIDGGSTRITSDGLVVGTPLYIAPEQARGLPADSRSDVYALGAVAYEMFLESPPFAGNNALEIVYCHIRDLPPTPRTLWPDMPPVLESLVMGMLSKEPEERPTLDLVCSGLDGAERELRRRIERARLRDVASRSAAAEPLPPPPVESVAPSTPLFATGSQPVIQPLAVRPPVEALAAPDAPVMAPFRPVRVNPRRLREANACDAMSDTWVQIPLISADDSDCDVLLVAPASALADLGVAGRGARNLDRIIDELCAEAGLQPVGPSPRAA